MSLVGAVVSIGCLIVALVWVMHLEARLPSIRVGAPVGDSTNVISTLEPGRYQAENPAITLSGNWFKQTLGTSSPQGTTSSMVTSTPGSSLTFRFYGTDLSMVARIGPESGKLRISVDGQESPILPNDSQGSFVDLYANQAEDQSILIATGLAHRDHTVKITSAGTDEVAISEFSVSANTPFPWAFVFLYVALTAAMFVLVRTAVLAVGRRQRWL